MKNEIMIGRTITHYKIIEKLGEGGMGVVYKAEDIKLKRTVALKFLPPELTRDKEAKKRFLHEARATSALDHPNICTIHEIGETEDGRMFMAMAHYEGQTLKDKIAQRPLPLAEAIDITLQIAEGLHEAHQNHIVHRDVKPANIIVTNKGQVKILDFGLAKLKGATKLTREGTTLGTVSYMSPEQAAGDAVDHRTDIWSLGVILYEMLTGQLPFGGHYEQAIMYAIMNADPEPVTGLRTGIPMELEGIITKILAKDPGERYQGMADLVVDLKKVKKDSKPEVTPIRKKTRPEITLKTSRKALILGMVFVTAIMVAAYFIFKGKPAPEILPVEPGNMPSLAVVYFENNSGNKNLDNWRQAFSELLTTDLAQSRYMKVLRSDEVFGIFKKLNLLEAERYSAQDLQEVARNGQVNHILKGSYIKAGDSFVITAMLINASSGETISSLSIRAEGEKDIFPKVDELTREIKSKLELTRDQITGDVDKEVSQIITQSPEALKFFMAGIKCNQRGELHKSIGFFEKALKIDPEFAFAYHMMSHAYTHLGHVSEGREFRKKALKFSQRLPDHLRLRIEADFYWDTEKNWNKKIEAYNKILQLYPTDAEINAKLAYAYQDLEEWVRAIERLQFMIDNKIGGIAPYVQIPICYQKKGLYEKARETLEFCPKNFKEHWLIRLSLAENYCLQHKFDRAMSEMKKTISLAPNQNELQKMKGDIYFYQGDHAKALEIYRNLMDISEKFQKLNLIQQSGYVYMSQGRFKEANTIFLQMQKWAKELKWEYWEIFIAAEFGILYFAQGQFNDCLKELNKILAAPKDWNISILKPYALYFAALAYLETKSWEQVDKVEAQFLEWANEQQNKKLIRFYYLFRGQKELMKKNYSAAVDYVNKAVSLLFHEYDSNPYQNTQALFYDALARVYLEYGNLEKATNNFEKITNLTVGRYHFGYLYTKAFYELGKIFEQQNQKDKAIKNYKKFIDLWKNCDPVFQPLVEDARKRVKELEGN